MRRSGQRGQVERHYARRLPDDPRAVYGLDIKPAAKTPKVFNQEISNEFGIINLDVVKPARLMVPSAKSLSGSPSSPAPGALDHFTCYKVKRTTGSPKFARRTVSIQTQFETATINVTKPLPCARRPARTARIRRR